MTEKLESKLRQAIELVGREEESIIKEDINKCLAMIELVFKDAGRTPKSEEVRSFGYGTADEGSIESAKAAGSTLNPYPVRK